MDLGQDNGSTHSWTLLAMENGSSISFTDADDVAVLTHVKENARLTSSIISNALRKAMGEKLAHAARVAVPKGLLLKAPVGP